LKTKAKSKKKTLKRKDRAFALMLETLSLALNCCLERNLQRYNFWTRNILLSLL